MKFIDQLGRSFILDHTPQRIVCLVPSLSELLVDLGLEKKLVGITKFCVHPESLRKEKTIVGGTKTVHFDRISALEPDIILCNKEENTREIVDKCANIAATHVSNIKTLEDFHTLLEHYGKLFNITQKTDLLSFKIKQKAADFSNFEKFHSRLKVFYLIWKKPYMAVGKDTFINHLLELNGFKNLALDLKGRYPEIDIEQLKEADLIMLSSEPFPFKEKHIEQLSTYTKAKILLVDGEYFSWYGSRLLSAFDYFKKLQDQIS
ncbi:MAG: helical backbone metal receptor [Leeuwenhoekiella sp.]